MRRERMLGLGAGEAACGGAQGGGGGGKVATGEIVGNCVAGYDRWVPASTAIV
jgi:hypothetical protein